MSKLTATFAALVLGAVGFPAATLGASSETSGRLIVKEGSVESDQAYFEGYNSYLKVRESSTGEVVVERRFVEGKMQLRRYLPPGRYELVSFIRPRGPEECSPEGGCEGSEGQAENRCSEEFRLRSEQVEKAEVRTKTGYRCRIRFR